MQESDAEDEAGDAGAAQPSEHRCPGSAFRSVGVWRRPASAASCGVGVAAESSQLQFNLRALNVGTRSQPAGTVLLAEVLVQAEGKGLWSSRHGDCSRGDGSSGACRCGFRCPGGLPTSTELQFSYDEVDSLRFVSRGALLYMSARGASLRKKLKI